MGFTFKDRVELRRLQSKMHYSAFGKQNDKVANALDVDARWIRQSRLNYRYIFKEKDAFWPEWAQKQYLKPADSAPYPMNELYCLNMQDKEFFSFTNLDESLRIDVTNNGYISFPFLNFGILLQEFQQDAFQSFFNQHVSLSDNGPLIQYEATQNNLTSAFKLIFDESTNLLKLSISYNNQSSTPIKKSLHLGILPYTNEGVGSIKHIHYLSNQRFVVNDQFIIQCNNQPSNVICTEFNQGNIFNHAPNWDMIFEASCPDFLASGLMSYDVTIPGKEMVSFDFFLSHSNKYIIPLFFPLKKIRTNRILNTNFEDLFNDTHLFNNTDLSIQNIASELNKTRIICNNFSNTATQSFVSCSFLEAFYYVYTVLQLNDQKKKTLLLSQKIPMLFQTKPLSFLLPKQSHLLFSISIITLFAQYRFIEHREISPYLQFIHKQLSNDYFICFIKKLSIQRFQEFIQSKSRFTIFLKLVMYHHLLSQLSSNHCNSIKGKKYEEMIDSFIQLTITDNDFIPQFIDYFSTTSEIPLDEKLFLSKHILFHYLSNQQFSTLVSNIETTYLSDTTIVQNDGSHEKNLLLFSLISPANISYQILERYCQHVNSLGHYFNQSYRSIGLQAFPYSIQSYHQLFLFSFFNLIYSETKTSLTISAALHFDSLELNNLHTRFGLISLSISLKNDNEISISFSHSFNYSPKNMYLLCPDRFKYSSFSFKKEKTEIKSNRVKIPLNQPKISLYI